jgi:hypothetical protein
MLIPPGTVQQQLRAALKDGATAEEAVRRVMEPYQRVLAGAGNDSLAGYARPAVLTEARRLYRVMMRHAEDRAFGAAPGSRERLALREMEFHLPDGTVVSWADATAEQHEARIAWLHTYIGSLETDLRRHERAVKLLAGRGAEKLADIDGWESLIGDDVDEDVVEGPGAGDGDDAGGEGVP